MENQTLESSGMPGSQAPSENENQSSLPPAAPTSEVQAPSENEIQPSLPPTAQIDEGQVSSAELNESTSLSSGLPTPIPETIGQVRSAQFNESISLSSGLPTPIPETIDQAPSENENQSSLPQTAPIDEGQVRSAHLNESTRISSDLPTPIPETNGQIPGLNNLPKGTDPAIQENKFAIPINADLDEINSILGGDWRNLALMISTADNGKMIGISKQEAKRKVEIYFADVREKQKKNLVVLFDVTINDLITRIGYLLSADVHWSCLAHCLNFKKEAIDGLKMIARIYKSLPDFDTFWSVFSMPHYNCRREVGKRTGQSREQERQNNEFFKELKELKAEVELQDSQADRPADLKKNKKLCMFISLENLWHYASSINKNELAEKFSQLSKMKIDRKKWEAYLKWLGISQLRKKNPGWNNSCIIYCLENVDFLGEQVCGNKYYVGSLGWPLTNKLGSKCQLTSSHVLLNENIFKELSKKENVNKMVKQEHTIPCRIGQKLEIGNKLGIGCDFDCFCKEVIGYIRSGCYKTGEKENNLSAGVEIVVIELSNNRVSDKNVEKGFTHYHWKKGQFPDKLNFMGQYLNHEDIEEGMVMYKLGNTTGLTMGRLKSKEKHCKFYHPFSKDDKNPSVVALYNQYEVDWEGSEFPFSQKGDSGGPVFTVNSETGEIKGVGILTGNDPELKISVVTPLHQVIEIIRTEYKLRNFVITLRKRL